MRNLRELRFRLRQEAANLRLAVAPPSTAADAVTPLPGLPDPRRLRDALAGTAFAARTAALAAQVLRGEIPVFGTAIPAGDQIRWRRDYFHGIETPARYYRFVPYLDFARAGDHKAIWELNRHQHLTLLAQDWLLSGRREALEAIWPQLESWLEQNPPARGVNWTSALEVAFRAVSWIWIWHLAGAAMPAPLARRFLPALYRHGWYLAQNLSWYFSPNTHLLGEAVALHAVGALFPTFPSAAAWKHSGREAVLLQMQSQVAPDGSHFEQSAYYHVYALDMFLFHAVLEPPPEWYRTGLERMAGFLDCLLGDPRRLPLIGDDDGGRWFYPFGRRDEFGRATLATCSRLLGRAWPHAPEDAHEQAVWWLGPHAPSPAPPLDRTSRFFENSGLAILRAGDAAIFLDAGPFGPWSGGHSHSDTLSVLARRGKEDVLVDAGTYTYMSDPRWRQWFRGSSAHNTVRVNGREPVAPAGPFGWKEKPVAAVREWTSQADRDVVDASLTAGGISHRRRLEFFKDARVAFILDEIDGPAGEHLLEQFWHLASAEARKCLAFPADAESESYTGGEHGWRSLVFYEKHAAPVIRRWRRGRLPARLWTVLDLSGAPPGVPDTSGGSCLYRGLRAHAS